MSTIKNFEDLEVWQLARQQSKKVCELLKSTPFTREFDLINQMKRSSGSVMDNIAEGFDREGNNEFIHFLSVSKGSNAELRSQFYRTLDNCLIEKNDFDLLLSENLLIGKKINSFMEYLKTTDNKGSKFKRT